MTLEECIEYAESQSEWMSKYTMIDIYKDKSEYYRQLAEWLKELQKYREKLTQLDAAIDSYEGCETCQGFREYSTSQFIKDIIMIVKGR